LYYCSKSLNYNNICRYVEQEEKEKEDRMLRIKQLQEAKRARTSLPQVPQDANGQRIRSEKFTVPPRLPMAPTRFSTPVAIGTSVDAAHSPTTGHSNSPLATSPTANNTTPLVREQN
jgi:hypothetical protein